MKKILFQMENRMDIIVQASIHGDYIIVFEGTGTIHYQVKDDFKI